MELQSPKFDLLRLVTISKSFPGITGAILGLFPSGFWFSTLETEIRDQVIEKQMELFSVSKDVLYSYFSYVVYFRNPILPFIKPEYMERYEIDNFKTGGLVLHELDLIDTGKFWEDIEGKVSRIIYESNDL